MAKDQIFSINTFKTGIDRGSESWQIPQDAFEELEDAYCYRGNILKRGGFNDFAYGGKNTLVGDVVTPECESRLVRKWASRSDTGEALTNATPATATLSSAPVRPHSVKVTDTGGNLYYDDGDGGFVDHAGSPVGSATINYITGAVSITLASTGASNTADYDAAETLTNTTPSTGTLTNIPIRRGGVIVVDDAGDKYYDDGVGGFFNASNVAVAGATIDYDTGAISITVGSVSANTYVDYDYHPGNQLVGFIDYYNISKTRKLLAVSRKDVNLYDATLNRFEAVQNTLTGVTNNYISWSYSPLPSDQSSRVLFTNGAFGSDNIKQYYDGAESFDDWTFTHSSITQLQCKLMFRFDDRIVLIDTNEEVSSTFTRYPYRVRWTGKLGNRDVLNASDASSNPTGATFNDLPDRYPITSAFLLRGSLIINTTNSTWVMKRSGSLTNPFSFTRLEEGRGADSTHGVLKFDQNGISVSRSGLTLTDGYRSRPFDDRLPDFTEQEIKSQYILNVFGYSQDVDHESDLIYLLYPSIESDSGNNNKMLVFNTRDKNWSQFNIPAAVYGYFERKQNETWSSLSRFESYAELASEFSSWAEFGNYQNDEITLLGGYDGQVWNFAAEILDDNRVAIRSITVDSISQITFTTDFAIFEAGDLIYIDSTDGLTNVNATRWRIQSVGTANYTYTATRFESQSPASGTHTSNTGKAWKVIEPVIKTAKFNPHWESESEIRFQKVQALIKSVDACKIKVETLLDDRRDPGTPYLELNLSGVEDQNAPSTKRISRIPINQTGRFIQLRLTSSSANAPLRIESLSYTLRKVGMING